MSNYTVSVNGFNAVIKVLDYSPPVPAQLSGPPEDCYPAEDGEIVWVADTGNYMLDNYINNDESCFEEIDEQLEKQIQEGYEDDRY